MDTDDGDENVVESQVESPSLLKLADLPAALDALCDETQRHLMERFMQLHTRHMQCEQSLERSVDVHRVVLRTMRDENSAQQREIDALETRVTKLQQQLRKEKHERREEKEWLTELWPDGVVLPSLLKPFEAHHLRDSAMPSDPTERRRLLARINRRVARERVLQQIEASRQWRIVVEPATVSTETGELGPERVYYLNAVTGESVWDAPLVMAYEPPPQWDADKMDWRDSYGIEHFYDDHPDSNAPGRKRESSSAADPAEDAALEARAEPASGAGERSHSDSDDQDKDDDDDKQSKSDEPADPVALRAQMTAALERHKQLQLELSASEAQQRALALQLLNASRESFEREAEAIALEDETTREAERKKRKALLQEQAAAKAKAEALEKKQQQSTSSGAATTVYAKFSKDSVGKKDLTLAKDDAALEQELDAFVLEQRADRAYLTVPLSLEPRVKFHHQLDDEYVHMKSMETQVLAIEQLEFDLLEKSALRHEEATAKADELSALCDQVRTQQLEVAADLESVCRAIARLDVPLPPPTEARPSADDLERASVRFVTLKPLDDDEGDDGEDGGGSDATRTESERAAMAADVAREHMTPEEIAALLHDEAELVLFKSFVDAEQHWRDWEREEAMRIDELAHTTTRRTLLERVQRQLALDLALAESDAPFFAQLGALEKALNTRLWAIQADSQTERVRFMIERAAREEAIFQMTDRLGELHVALEAAQRLPLQALNPLERLQLEDESRKQCAAIAAHAAALQASYDKEMAAKTLLIELEMRSSRYAKAKLEEEMALFREKQALWDLNFALADELQDARKTIERLFVLMQEEGDDSASVAAVSVSPLTLLDSGASLPSTDTTAISTARRERYAQLQQQQDDATGVFDTKLQSQQHVRQFLLSCYDREARWRQLAAIALIPDTSSHEWMTSMQRERHESMLAILQDQHAHETQALQQQLAVLHQVKRKLLTQIDDLHTKLERVQRAYQASSDHVREQTERVIQTLSAEIAALQQTLRDEKTRAQAERERLVHEHDGIRTALDARILELEAVNEQQRHWLTATKRELHAQRIANEELVKAYASLEKRRATETNDMRFRITAQIAKINNIEMWNLSLKLQAKDAQRERIALQREMDALVAQHKQQQQLLRLRNWRQRVTAQAILTNVDVLFRFFVDGLDILAGATHDVNTALRTHGAIEVLAVLAQHCHAQQAIRVVCARALGQLAWNANTTPRALGWRAKRTWLAYVTAQSDAVLVQLSHEAAAAGALADVMAFDAVADEASSSMNWLADPSACAGESDFDDAVRKQQKKIRFVQTWHQLDELRFPDTNARNQAHMALSPSVLQTIIDLCYAPSQRKLVRNGDDSSSSEEDAATATQIQRNALRSLALIVMDARNTAIIGRMDGCVAHLVGLIAPHEPPEDAHIVRHAVFALSNLAFGNASNQVAITTHGAVPHLLAFCADATDVDLIVAATQALAHLTHLAQPQVCEVLLDNDAIPILTELCHSPRIYDAVELDVYEQIQTNAAQVLASVVAALDTVENESDHRARSVADAILEADNELLQSGAARGVGGVASFVLMCASCNRDVAYHAAVVLGSVAQHDAIREVIGAAGGVDALFLLADRRSDSELVLQATWALANLTWNQDNQYRIARYMPTLFALCSLSVHRSFTTMTTTLEHTRPQTNQEQEDASASASARPEQDSSNNNSDDGGGDDQIESDSSDDAAVDRQIREYALCILANALFYNDANRQLVASQPQWMALLQSECVRGHGVALEHAARALCALSYSDTIALSMGVKPTGSSSSGMDEEALSGLEVFIRLCGHAASPLVQRHGLYGVINLCLHDANKSRMLDVPHGIETLVNLSGATDKELCVPALEALELLADVRQFQRDGIASSRALASSTDVKKLIALLSDATSPALVAMVSDAIADEVWKTPSAKVKLRNEHGLEKLLQLCVQPLHEILGASAAHAVSVDDERKLLVSCLWALRNTVSDNVRNQDLVGALDGVAQLVLLYDRQRRHEDVVEGVLAALVALVLKHPRNSQQLVQFGLDMLLGLADSARHEDERTVLPPLGPTRASAASPLHTPTASSSRRPELQNAALARELLHLVAPYNALPPPVASTSSPDKLSKLRRLQHQRHHSRAESAT